MQSWCRTWPPNGSSCIRAKQKLLRKHIGACKSSWSQIEKPEVIYTDNSLEFGKACEDLSWNHCTSTPHRPETNGIAKRAVRRVKEGTSAVLSQSGLDENWWADSMECYICETLKILSDGKTPYERRFGEPFCLHETGIETEFVRRHGGRDPTLELATLQIATQVYQEYLVKQT